LKFQPITDAFGGLVGYLIGGALLLRVTPAHP
jgi:hypothetical protein